MNTADVYEPSDQILTCNTKANMVFVWRVDSDGMLRLMTPLAEAGPAPQDVP